MTEDIIITEEALKQAEERCTMLQEKVNGQGEKIDDLKSQLAEKEEELTSARKYWQDLYLAEKDEHEETKRRLEALLRLIANEKRS